MAKNDPDLVHEKLDRIIEVLQHLLALELAREGMTQESIGKHLRIAKASVVAMLKGAKRDGGSR